MAITHKDINLLTQKATIAGTEKLPVSDTEYLTPAQITAVSEKNLYGITATSTLSYSQTTRALSGNLYYFRANGVRNTVLINSSLDAAGKFVLTTGGVVAARTTTDMNAGEVLLLSINSSGEMTGGILQPILQARATNGVSDVTLGGSSVVSGGVAVLPAYPDITGKQDVIDSSHKLSYALVDTSSLTQKSAASGTEKIPVSGTEYLTVQQVMDQTIEYTLRAVPLTPDETTEGVKMLVNGSTTSMSTCTLYKYSVVAGATYVLNARMNNFSQESYLMIWKDSNGDVIGYDIHYTARDNITYSNYYRTAPVGAVNLYVNIQTYYNSTHYLKKASDEMLVPKKVSDLTNDAGYGTYTKPSGGIPATDIASGVIPTISTSITTDASDDTKTASPHAVKTYVDNMCGDIETLLAAI